jgi:hypothetical protein
LRILLTVLFLGCASGTEQHFHLNLPSSVSKSDGGVPRLEMRAGEIRVLQLLVVGSVPGPVAISAFNPPPFVTLDGPLVTFAPSRQDAGDYQVTLQATSGSETESVTLLVTVGRFNSAPRWTPFFQAQGFGDDLDGWRFVCPSPEICTAGPNPFIATYACDAEGDGVVADVEVVPRGQPFAKKTSYSQSFPAIYPPPEGGNCRNFQVRLPGLAPERSYDFAVRVSDEFGAVAQVAGSPDGWYHTAHEGFDQGPCATRQCACAPSGSHCAIDLDCCSGTCNQTPSGYPPFPRCK